MRYKNYWEDSFTKYSNEIGLTPEDIGKKEIYYHNILAKEEIDTLFAPKVFSNIKKYDKDGEYRVNNFSDKDRRRGFPLSLQKGTSSFVMSVEIPAVTGKEVLSFSMSVKVSPVIAKEVSSFQMSTEIPAVIAIGSELWL